MKLVHQYVVIFFNFWTTSSHLHPRQVENCDSNSRLVVDEDDNGEFMIESVKYGPALKGLIIVPPPKSLYSNYLHIFKNIHIYIVLVFINLLFLIKFYHDQYGF